MWVRPSFPPCLDERESTMLPEGPPPVVETPLPTLDECESPAPLEPADLAAPRGDWAGLVSRIEDLGRELGQLSLAVQEVVDNQQHGAEQIRRLGRKVDQIATVVADHRLRDLAGGLLLFHDLLAGLADNPGSGTSVE